MRADVEERFAAFVEAEHQFRRDGESAITHRLGRLRLEIDAYIGRLNTAKTLVVLRAEDRERAYARTEAMIGHHARAIEARAASPPPQSGPYSIARWLRNR
jgi:hypothetical protein